MFCNSSNNIIRYAYVQGAVSFAEENVCVAFLFHKEENTQKQVGEARGLFFMASFRGLCPLRHSDAEAFSVMLRGVASKHPVKSCIAKREITGPFAALRVTRTRNVLAVILTLKRLASC